MVFAEAFLLELGSGGGGFSHDARIHHLVPTIGRKAIQISGNELEAGVVEGGAAVICESYPAVEVGGFVVSSHGQNIVGIPRKAVGEVRGFDLLFARAGILERHKKRRAVIEIRRNVGEAEAFGVASGDDVVTDFPNLPVVVGEKSGLDLFVLGGAVVLIGADERHFLANIFV